MLPFFEKSDSTTNDPLDEHSDVEHQKFKRVVLYRRIGEGRLVTGKGRVPVGFRAQKWKG